MLFKVLVAGAVMTAPAFSQTVHPAAATVPANLLRLSLSFERPQHGSVGRDLRLTKADGHPLDGALYPQLLWSPDKRTLTVYLDPGRVKTGLALRDAMGAILNPGDTVQVRSGDHVLQTWSVTTAREAKVRPALDALRTPAIATREKLILPFEQSVDWQSRDLIAVQAPDGSRVDGVADLVDSDRTWTFEPKDPWRAGRYVLRLHPDLEDPEGNRVAQAFETSHDATVEPRGETKRVFVIDAR